MIDQEIQHHLFDVILFVFKLVIQKNRLASLLRNLDSHIIAPVIDPPVDGLINLSQSQDVSTCGDEGTDSGLNLSPLEFQDFEDLV